MAHFPPAYPCNTGWIDGDSMQISELSKTETRLGGTLPLKSVHTTRHSTSLGTHFLIF